LLYVSLAGCAHAPATPDQLYGQLFDRIQRDGIFSDSKTFPDCLPKKTPGEIVRDYEIRSKTDPDFSLKKLVEDDFTLPPAPSSVYTSTASVTLAEHISTLWPALTRQPDIVTGATSLLPLKYPYVVPGGRFREVYYWDSYFTMLGLEQSGRTDMMENMVANFAMLIDKYGHIPNGNRTYYLSRSQPPFFTLMVKTLARRDAAALDKYVPAIEKEYAFWMDGAASLKMDGQANRRAVKMGSALLNRYWDDNPIPRQEAWKEDIKTAESSARAPQEVYRNIRAAAESGMDFSSRWFADPAKMTSIETTSIIPVDLNCLLYDTEMTLASYWQDKDARKAAFYSARAQARKEAINKLLFDEAAGFYVDYNFIKGEQTGRLTLAGMAPFFLNAAPKQRGAKAAEVITEKFLKKGGVVTTLVSNGQQWDSPNGWAPLQWMTVKGLLNYGQDGLALDIAHRWTNLNEKVYARTGRMMEKYNVTDDSLEAGGGEYPGQDGFGWTNGVYLALKALPALQSGTVK